MIKNLIIKKNNSLNLKKYIKKNHKKILKKYLYYGCVIFRNFKVKNLKEFQSTVFSSHKNILNYNESSTPRTEIKKKIYTSTEISNKFTIPLHNELSYSKKYPRNLWFYCEKPSLTGGETSIASTRKVFKRINKKISNLFKEKKIKYIRRYGYGADLSWKNVFNTDKKNVVEKYCKKNGFKIKWEGNKLITEQTNNATLNHPIHKFEIWFNQAHLFHNSNLNKKTKKAFLKIFGKNKFPRDAKFGDNSNISCEHLNHVRNAFKKEKYKIKWKKGDVVLIDNFHISHGREKYTGNRKLYVIMTNDNNFSF